ncbi:MAG: hypothetical protein M1825_002265 [Sarcosagium campestre]|nr:MAG: hypothetical protein M1825_002265 [Sarcosagium campestre]
MTRPPPPPPQPLDTGKHSLADQTGPDLAPHSHGSDARRRIISSTGTSTSTSSAHFSRDASSKPLPLRASFSSVLNSSSRDGPTRQQSTSAASTSTFAAIQSGSQQSQSSQPSSTPTSKATAPSSQTAPSLFTAASTTAYNGGGGGGSGGGGAGGGGGGGAVTGGANHRPSSFSPSLSQSGVTSPVSGSFSQNAAIAQTSNSNLNNQSGQLSKIVIAQIFLLLSTIKEDKDKTKWDSQAEQIRKLIDSNGMDVFAKYFRRLLVGNSPQIFPGVNRAVENPGNYPLLAGELRRVSQDGEQARKIAETIDTSDGDLFRDFDLSTFMDHFKLDPLEKTILALAFKTASRADLRTKADAILSNNFHRFLEVLSSSSASDDERHSDLQSSLIVQIVEGFTQYPPPNFNDDGRVRLSYAVQLRHQNLNTQVPIELSTALQLLDIVGARQTLARVLQNAGPRSTSSLEACRDVLQSAGNSLLLDPSSIAASLLFMVITPNWQQYTPAVFVTVLREHSQAQRISWQGVVRGFDREGVTVDKDRFMGLYNALLPVALDDSSLDIQTMWGGRWKHPDTQLSFVIAFASLSPSELDAASIPRLRRAFSISDFSDASENVKAYAAKAVSHPLVSLDAITALFEFSLQTPEFFVTPVGRVIFQDVVQPNMDVFLCAGMAVPKPWTDTQQDVLQRLFVQFLFKQYPSHEFVLHCLWKIDKHWVATKLVELHSQDALKLPAILEQARDHRWLDDLGMILNGFGLDLVALAHRRGYLDLESWATAFAQRQPQEFAVGLLRFLTLKAEDEMRAVAKEPSAARTVSLAPKTVNTMLEILEEAMSSEERREEINTIQRLCIQAYPRLINYGEGFDDVIDANGEESNAIPERADKMMQEHYKNMYSGERDVRDVVEALRRYKQSRDPAEQDLFACMIHGLFDEYPCYREYPLEALATTAVLFGGIINFNLISGIPLRVGLGMILEAVKDYGVDSSMYKFGLQALLHFFNRLQEWPGFCSRLVQVPGLQGTEAFNKAEEVLRERTQDLPREEEVNTHAAQNGYPPNNTLTNGGVAEDAFNSDPGPQGFQSIHADPPSQADDFVEPDEEVQDKVLFVLNNISEQNLEVKLRDLQDALGDRHIPWFAKYLVEERAKAQPNFHKLYLDMLNQFGAKKLWSEVLRETYVSVIRMLNAQSTMDSSTERAHLKSLGSWLGSLTIARDKPIKHTNISFKDLLIEAYDTQRLILIIPFTCKVLVQASKSVVFKPPNPWLMEIIGLLVELYQFAELRLQLKFEIEVLCKDLGLDHRAIEPSSSLRDRPSQEEELAAALPDALDGFEDMSLGLGRPSARTERFSPSAITSSLPDIGSLLVYPPTSNTSINRESLRYIVENAVRKAIQEIISPVVERSVTIAAISTAQLIHKDFGMEPNEERVRQSALTMVKALAGSLALVTCKEPLRMSMTNYIRVLSAEVGDQALPEGAILMCVNDNLDTACGMVESAAEQRSMPEIEDNIEQQLSMRRRHRATRPTEPFYDPIVRPFAFYIPEPYRLSANGLNKEQMAIYEEFARQSRVPPSHTNASSTDSGRHIVNEVLQDQYPSVPHLPTPLAEPTVLSHPASQQGVVGRGQPSQVPGQATQIAINGFIDAKSTSERAQDLLLELQRTASEAPEEHVTELAPDSAVIEIFHQILRLILMGPRREEVAYEGAMSICTILDSRPDKPLVDEVFVQLLKELCDASSIAARAVTMRLNTDSDERILNVPATVALLSVGLVDIHRLDSSIGKLIGHRRPESLEYLSELMDEVLFGDKPVALRADFAGSLEALSQWLSEEPDLPSAKQIVQKLRDSGIHETIGSSSTDERSVHHRDQVEYTFSEWVRLCGRPDASEKTSAAFIAQLHAGQLIDSVENSCIFFRICVDLSVESYERAEAMADATLSEAFSCVDSLAKLVVSLLRYHGEGTGEVTSSKASFLKSTLSLLTLILNHHYVMRGERFNQRVFFRLFSTTLFECNSTGMLDPVRGREIILVFASTFLTLQPDHFPGFLFGWLSLISHRSFLPNVLLLSEQAGWEPYVQIMQALLSFLGELLKPVTLTPTAKEAYRGFLRIMLVLHHDFPEFLSENHTTLCQAIPMHCIQPRNLVLSAYPSSFTELPDPFTAGLKVDRINEIRRAPVICGDIESPLRSSGIKEVVDAVLVSGPTDDQVATIVQAVQNPQHRETGIGFKPINVDLPLLTSLVVYVGTSAVTLVGQKGGPTFVQNSPHAMLLSRLATGLDVEARYFYFGALANQLRYPNSHTHYFSYAILFLFGNDQHNQNDAAESDVRQLITRVLLERLIVHRPHPWGLIITLLELLKNPNYLFWDLPFIKAAPEIERLFGALFQHINQSPR